MKNFTEIYEASEDALTARLRAIRGAIGHAGVKGTLVENAVADFLRSILPEKIGICTGVAVDSDLNSSGQLDLILYDKAHTPLLFGSDGVYLVTIECIYFIVEIKTSLTKEEFKKSILHMESVKNLKRKAYYLGHGNEIKRDYFEGFEPTFWQTIYLIFALESKANGETILGWFEDHRSSSLDIRSQIDSMFVLGKGIYSNATLSAPDKIRLNLTPSAESLPAHNAEDGILGFLSIFSRFYNNANIGADFDFTKYTKLSRRLAVPSKTDRSIQLIEKAEKDGFVFPK